jgi:putative GTP pyrophosphokinase
MDMAKQRFPGGSRKRVNRAGDAVRAFDATNEDMRAIEEWRSAHRHVLNTFQAILRTRTRRTDVIVAQRHKRRRTIFDKLQRFPDMQLSRMDDVAGCRLIFQSVERLEGFRTQFHQARFRHKRRNEPDKYNYMLTRRKILAIGEFMTYMSMMSIPIPVLIWRGFSSRSNTELSFSTRGRPQ